MAESNKKTTAAKAAETTLGQEYSEGFGWRRLLVDFTKYLIFTGVTVGSYIGIKALFGSDEEEVNAKKNPFRK